MKKREHKGNPGVEEMKIVFEKIFIPESLKEKYTFKFTNQKTICTKIPQGCSKFISNKISGGYIKINVGTNDDVCIFIRSAERVISQITLKKETCSKVIDFMMEAKALIKQDKKGSITFHGKEPNHELVINYYSSFYDGIELVIKEGTIIKVQEKIYTESFSKIIKVLRTIENFLRPHVAKKRTKKNK